MFDELFFSSKEDGNLKTIEEMSIEKIRDQISNKHGELTGKITKETDYIQDYIKRLYTSNDPVEIIENLEHFSSEFNNEEKYDFMSSNIIKIFKETIGVSFDIDREMISFNDIYNVYVIFILNLRETIELSYKGFYTLNGINDAIISIKSLSEYLLSDEFSPNDDFIKNASFVSENDLIKKIKTMIDDFLISIDCEIFTNFIYNFITRIEF
jgi:hypothetical protein